MLTKLKGELLIATNNAGKLLEMQQLLAELEGVTLLAPREVGIDIDVPETGTTYAENAALKASAYMRASGLPTLADDSGLEVDALNGAPGLHSKRYSSKPNATDADRRAFLVANLAEFPRPWSARFVACVAFGVPGGELSFWEGACSGEIIPEQRGTNGFGYDPIFYFTAEGRTMAELSDAEKNAVSHRGNAIRAALPTLRKHYSGRV